MSPTDRAFEVLTSRPEWVERCRNVCQVYRAADSAASALQAYAKGNPSKALDEVQPDDHAALQAEDIDWAELVRRFQ